MPVCSKFEDYEIGQTLFERQLGPITTEMMIRWAAAARCHYSWALQIICNDPDVGRVHGNNKLRPKNFLSLHFVGYT
jgi:hypothetical protein